MEDVMKRGCFVFTMLALLGMAVSAPSVFADSGGSKDKDKDGAEKSEKAADSKVTICHVTGGNPSNRHTLSVDQSAVDAHMNHGDSMGACAAVAATGSHAPSNVREIHGR